LRSVSTQSPLHRHVTFCNSNILAADSIDTTDQHVPALATETGNEPVTGLNVAQNNSQVNSENTTGNSTAISTGFFLPESVANLAYRTSSQSGFTDADGAFNYLAGETVVFSIGNVELPTVQAKSTITPLDLFPDSAIDHRGVINVSRLLQSLDEDSDPTNGVVLADSAHTLLTVEPLEFESLSFSEKTIALIERSNASGTLLIPASTAIEHLANSLNADASNGPENWQQLRH